MRETWYVLEDGTFADPNDVGHDEFGALRHKDGVAVAMKRDCAHSRSMSEEDRENARQARTAEPAADIIVAESPAGAISEPQSADTASPAISPSMTVAKGPGGRWFHKAGDEIVSKGFPTEEEANAALAELGSAANG